MFDIGFQELLLCALIALIVLGPKRLPEAARAAGRWVGQARRFISAVQRDLQEELRTEDLREFRRLKDELDEARQALSQASGELGRSLNERIDSDEPAKTATDAPETAPAPAVEAPAPAAGTAAALPADPAAKS